MALELSAAWMLHSRPYKESSLLAEFLVEGVGRVPMVVKGARKPRSLHASLLQPFCQVMVSWRGQGELKSLTAIEPETSLRLTGKSLFCGFYINELILRTVIAGQPSEGLIELYTVVIHKLAEAVALEPLLRFFELELLELMGYLPSLQQDTLTGLNLTPENKYHFQPGTGLIPASEGFQKDQRFLYHYDVLKALASRDFSNHDFYPDFKRFTRQALSLVLGDRPLKSRELFSRVNKTKI